MAVSGVLPSLRMGAELLKTNSGKRRNLVGEKGPKRRPPDWLKREKNTPVGGAGLWKGKGAGVQGTPCGGRNFPEGENET